jgi:hypothetical protein
MVIIGFVIGLGAIVNNWEAFPLRLDTSPNWYWVSTFFNGLGLLVIVAFIAIIIAVIVEDIIFLVRGYSEMFDYEKNIFLRYLKGLVLPIIALTQGLFVVPLVDLEGGVTLGNVLLMDFSLVMVEVFAVLVSYAIFRVIKWVVKGE